MSLNELNEELERTLPQTDSRYRPDIRCLETGDIGNYSPINLITAQSLNYIFICKSKMALHVRSSRLRTDNEKRSKVEIKKSTDLNGFNSICILN